jgi:hypothetical protein
MIVAVFFGSRDWADAWTVEEVVERLILEGDGSLKGIHGGARGLDSLADAVLRRRGFSPISVKASWTEHDRGGRGPVPCRCAPPRPGEDDTCRAAGIRRNQLIIDEHLMPAIEDPDAEVWACGFRTAGRSPGTDDMRERIRPLVADGLVRGIFNRAAGLPPAERRRLHQVQLTQGRLDPWPEG